MGDRDTEEKKDIIYSDFAYDDAQIALDTKELSDNHMCVEFPYSGILVLRGERTFDKAYIELSTPGGELRYPIEIRYMSDVTIDMIFEKHLYMLLPFYIFNLEEYLDEINADDMKLESLADIYRNIIESLDDDLDKGYLSGFSHGVIISLIDKVVYKITMGRKSVLKNVQEKVGGIMGGRVLDLEVIRAHRDGLVEGKAEEKNNNIRKLATSYMNQDSSLTEEKAMEMARAILG